MLKISKILFAIALIVIVAGVVMYSIKGFVYEENSMKLKDMILPFLTPVIVVFVLNLVFYYIKYRKIGILEILGYVFIITIIVQLLLISIYAIARIKINSFIMPISMFLYIVTYIILTEVFENKLKLLSKQK